MADSFDDPFAPAGDPRWLPSTPFPEQAAPILRKNRLSQKQYPKWSSELTRFLATQLAGDFAIVLQKKLRGGDKDVIKLLSQIYGQVKNDSIGVNVNFQQNIGIQAGGSHRQIDSLVRMLDERDRTKIIDAPVAGEDKEFEEEDEEE